MAKAFRLKKFSRAGFTLIELVTVCIILGVLASVALPAYRTYILRARTAEAPVNLQNIVNGELTFLERPRVDPNNGNELRSCWATSSDRHPYTLAQVPLSVAKNWMTPDAPPNAFNVINFRPSAPVFYTYSMDNGNTLGAAFNPAVGGIPGYCLDGSAAGTNVGLTSEGLRIRAVGDLDGDLLVAGEAGMGVRVARYGRFITAVNGIATVGALVSTDEYE